MSQFVSDELIKISITEEIEKLNECITEWYHNNFPDDVDDFNCCDEDEINLLVKCYYIFSENINLQVLDYDVIKALLMYYYIVVVFEYNVYRYIFTKYLKIIYERVNKSGYLRFMDNDHYTYQHYPTILQSCGTLPCISKRTKPIKIKKEINMEEFYIRSNKDNLRETDPYIYRDKELTEKVISDSYMDCFENMLVTEKSKEYYDLLYMGSEDWISQIRRLILNMNTELFEGHKGGKKILKKNTKKINLKKICKKSRKNKGKKRVNKIYMP